MQQIFRGHCDAPPCLNGYEGIPIWLKMDLLLFWAEVVGDWRSEKASWLVMIIIHREQMFSYFPCKRNLHFKFENPADMFSSSNSKSASLWEQRRPIKKESGISSSAFHRARNPVLGSYTLCISPQGMFIRRLQSSATIKIFAILERLRRLRSCSRIYSIIW